MSKGLDDAAQREVEELLKAAQDDLLLKISINRLATSSSSFCDEPSSSLDPDLARRFDALKVGRKGADKIDGDDLSARFDALKGTHHSDEKNDRILAAQQEPEDEVEKVMRWAMDAVRLHVISNSKGNDDVSEKSIESEESEESDLEESDEEKEREKKKKKEKAKQDTRKPPTKKWFIF